MAIDNSLYTMHTAAKAYSPIKSMFFITLSYVCESGQKENNKKFNFTSFVELQSIENISRQVLFGNITRFISLTIAF